jgi:hypothetical protein
MLLHEIKLLPFKQEVKVCDATDTQLYYNCWQLKTFIFSFKIKRENKGFCFPKMLSTVIYQLSTYSGLSAPFKGQGTA